MTTPSDPLSRGLSEAIAGRPQSLYDLLTRGSRLPGTRMNEDLAEAFAQACRGIGARADGVALAMARLSAERAPGATALEFVPVCGLYAIAARAAADTQARGPLVAELHAHCDDLRFRVRDAVVKGLARVGGAAGETLVHEVASWMDGYFHAAAVLLALADDTWLTALHDAAPVVQRLDDAFALVRDAPRSAARWPGHKAVVDALRATPPRVAIRFGVPVFDLLARWAATQDPSLRDVVEAAIASKALPGRFGGEVGRVRDALVASRPPARNPDHNFGPSRDRSKNRRKNRR